MTKIERWIVWGYSKPGYCCWAAVLFTGRIYILDEWLFRKTVAADVALEIKDRTAKLLSEHPRTAVGKAIGSADMWPDDPEDIGESLNSTFGRHGVSLTKGSEARIAGWNRFRHWLRLAPDASPWMVFHPRCSYALRTIPFLVEDADEPEDLPKKLDNDQAAHALRMGVMARPTPMRLTEAMPVILPDSVAAMIRQEFGTPGRRPMGMVS